MNYSIKTIAYMATMGLGLLPVETQAQRSPKDRYLDVDQKNGKISVDYNPQNKTEAEYKALSDAQQAQVKFIEVYRSDNGASLLKVGMNRGSYVSETFFYQPAELKDDKHNAFVAVEEMGMSADGYHTSISLENDNTLDITPGKIQVKNKKTSRLFKPAGRNQSLASHLYEANPDQHSVEYMFKSQNGDIMVLTAPIHDEKNYYNFKAYKIKDEKLTPLGNVRNVERMRDGGTTMGEFEDNGQTVAFYSPSPFNHNKPASFNGIPVESMDVDQHSAIIEKFSSQMKLPGPQVTIAPTL